MMMMLQDENQVQLETPLTCWYSSANEIITMVRCHLGHQFRSRCDAGGRLFGSLFVVFISFVSSTRVQAWCAIRSSVRET